MQEHTDLVASIRAGKPSTSWNRGGKHANGDHGPRGGVTGQELTWDEVLNADQDLTPPQVAFGPLPVSRRFRCRRHQAEYADGSTDSKA